MGLRSFSKFWFPFSKDTFKYSTSKHRPTVHNWILKSGWVDTRYTRKIVPWLSGWRARARVDARETAAVLIQSHNMRTPMWFKQSDRFITHVQVGMLGKLKRKLKQDLVRARATQVCDISTARERNICVLAQHLRVFHTPRFYLSALYCTRSALQLRKYAYLNHIARWRGLYSISTPLLRTVLSLEWSRSSTPFPLMASEKVSFKDPETDNIFKMNLQLGLVNVCNSEWVWPG